MKFLSCLLAAVPILFSVATAEDTRCFELRTYHANEGKLDALHGRFRDHTIKLFEKHGFQNIGYWVPRDNKDNVLIYVIASPDMEANKASWKAFIDDAEWKAAYKESVNDGKLVGKIDSVFLQATDYSPEIKATVATEPQLFELRTYNTNAGKLDGLNARFRDHTTQLFSKHGLSQFAYWTPTAEKDGRDTRMVYLLSHKDEESRNANFKAFGTDPQWQAARKASEENGKLLVKDGVESVFLIPTDYSPTK
jgi:hypothetical protein